MATLKYYKSLDGYRGLAAIAVLIFHFVFEQGASLELHDIAWLKKLTRLGQHGVTFFFVLSGFVITRILINTKGESNYFKRFYQNRLLRIFPLYYGFLLIYYYVGPYITSSIEIVTFEKQVPFYLYINNLYWLFDIPGRGPGHYWSLAVEEHFYLIWPLFLWLMPKRILGKGIVVLILFSFPLKAYFLSNNIDINYNTFSRYDSILFGAYIAWIEYKNNWVLPKISLKSILYTVFSALLFGSILLFYRDQIVFAVEVLKHSILSVFFAAIIYVTLINESGNKLIIGLLNSSSLQYLGRISYGIYVWHMLIIFFLVDYGSAYPVLNLFLALALTIIIAHISFSYFESYFLKFKQSKKS